MKTSPWNFRCGFTLIEMLVVILILAVLATLGMTAGRSAIARSRRATCVANLRSLSLVFHQYAAERNGAVRFLRDGSGASMWYTELRKQAGFTDEQAQRAFGCPSTRWQDTGSWYCYGMRLGYLAIRTGDDPGYPILRDDNGATYGFSLARVEEPGQFLLMADSATSSGRQNFRLADRKLYSGGGVCLRHDGTGNALFLDGHVENLNAAGFARYGVEQVLDGEYRTVTP